MISSYYPLVKAAGYLVRILPGMIDRKLDPERVARVGSILHLSGLNQKTGILTEAGDYVAGLQRSDGGWSNIEETIWSVYFLRGFNDSSFKNAASLGAIWLKSQQSSEGGWGQTSRDVPRIPLTGLLLSLIPDLGTNRTWQWLETVSCAEVTAPVLLTYKSAIPLIAMGPSSYKESKIKLLQSLIREQNTDGGFGPWRGHPVGSETWSTSFAVIALSRLVSLLNDFEPLSRAIKWLEQTQIEDGSWPYHFLDEGAALGCWALYEAALLQKNEVK